MMYTHICPKLLCSTEKLWVLGQSAGSVGSCLIPRAVTRGQGQGQVGGRQRQRSWALGSNTEMPKDTGYMWPRRRHQAIQYRQFFNLRRGATRV